MMVRLNEDIGFQVPVTCDMELAAMCSAIGSAILNAGRGIENAFRGFSGRDWDYEVYRYLQEHRDDR